MNLQQRRFSRCLPQLLFSVLAGFSINAPAAAQPETVNLSPETWQADYSAFLEAQAVNRKKASHATGKMGAVTVAYNGLAARAGLEALKQGGSAIDAALTAANTQIALTAGSPISYFGILSLVYYDKASDTVYTMNAEWNTVRGETLPLGIPGGIDFSSEDALRGRGAPSGRTALVGGYMKGVEAAHARFGKLPFDQLFAPAIYVAEKGMEVTERLKGQLEFRDEDLRRLPATRAVFFKPDGSAYETGDIFKQPALAATLGAVAEHGADYMYGGPWGESLIAAIKRDGGHMTLEDLRGYEVLWDEPLVGKIGGYEVYTNPAPNAGGIALIEAQNLALEAGLHQEPHWTQSGEALRRAVEVSYVAFLDFLPEAARRQLFPGVTFTAEARRSKEYAEMMYKAISAGQSPLKFRRAEVPKHSDDVVAIDASGNIAAITHSINTVYWGKTAINIGGISIGDPASFQQAQVRQAGPGNRMRSPTETGILKRDGHAVLGFASMGSGLHQRTFQGLLNYAHFGMSVAEAIDAPDFFLPHTDPKTLKLTVQVPKGRFPKEVLDAMGYAYREVDSDDVRLGGEGIWVAIERDPETGQLSAASHNRNNSAAVAF